MSEGKEGVACVGTSFARAGSGFLERDRVFLEICVRGREAAAGRRQQENGGLRARQRKLKWRLARKSLPLPCSRPTQGRAVHTKAGVLFSCLYSASGSGRLVSPFLPLKLLPMRLHPPAAKECLGPAECRAQQPNTHKSGALSLKACSCVISGAPRRESGPAVAFEPPLFGLPRTDPQRLR